jgi:hypothetical protein
MLENILFQPQNCETILLKVLTPNDDAGRHGVLIPVSAYAMFPTIAGFDATAATNYTEQITYISDPDEAGHAGSYKHYHRYPERRLTRLPRCFNDAPDRAAILVAKRSNLPWAYEIHFLDPQNDNYAGLLAEFGLFEPEPGTYFLNLQHRPQTQYQVSPSLMRLLNLFDDVSSRGYIRTLRQGPTGVGYTFETLLGIEENNNRGPDFEGIELKCYRLGQGNNNIKKNLFLREPRWIDTHTDMASRVRGYGYIDDESRPALYSAVTASTNCHDFALEASADEEKVFLTYNCQRVAEWTFRQLQERLDEKLTHAAFIGAKKRGAAAQEEFHYQTFKYCRHPSVDSFIALVEAGQVIVELRMHVKENGTVRNHGTAFRLNEDRLPDLFAEVRGMRE